MIIAFFLILWARPRAS